MGLKVSDFDTITLKQFITLSRKYYEKFKRESEIYAFATFQGIGNAFRKEGVPYRELWTENEGKEMTHEDIRRFHEERMELFKEVGVIVK